MLRQSLGRIVVKWARRRGANFRLERQARSADESHATQRDSESTAIVAATASSSLKRTLVSFLRTSDRAASRQILIVAPQITNLTVVGPAVRGIPCPGQDTEHSTVYSSPPSISLEHTRLDRI